MIWPRDVGGEVGNNFNYQYVSMLMGNDMAVGRSRGCWVVINNDQNVLKAIIG